MLSDRAVPRIKPSRVLDDSPMGQMVPGMSMCMCMSRVPRAPTMWQGVGTLHCNSNVGWEQKLPVPRAPTMWQDFGFVFTFCRGCPLGFH